MRRYLPLVLLLTAASHTFAQDKPDVETLEERAFKQATALAEPSILQIETVGGLDRVGQVLANDGPTTGVAVSKDGYIISSSFNFINKPTSIVVRLPDGRPLPAKVVATDSSKMLTLLKVEANDLVPAKAAPKKDLQVGQWAIAMGRTYDNTLPSASVGIVSALDRIWGRAIQTDAKTSPVNYGGPLVDIEGRVMGITVPLSTRGKNEAAGVEWYDGGIGFAIPLEDVYRVMDRLKSGEDLKPGLMGISFKGAGLLGGDPKIDRVRPNSPAAQAGFKAGDVITEVDGSKIIRQAGVKHALGKKYSGDKVAMTVKRGDETISKELTLIAELTPYESAFLGILPIREGENEKLGAGVGVRVVYPDSPAKTVGLENRDRIVKFDGKDITDAATLTDLVSRFKPGEKATIEWKRDDKEFTKEVELASIPNSVLGELRSTPYLPPKEKPEEFPKTGHFDDTAPDGETSYWCYVPGDYNPAYPYSLMVWVHPPDDTMEAELLKIWKPICQQRGIILVGPRAGNISKWTPNETTVMKDIAEDLIKRYSIDESRVFVHSWSNSGAIAYQLAFKFREVFRGICTVGAPIGGRPPENDPNYRFQFHLVCGEKDPALARVKRSVDALQKVKYPASQTTVKDLDGNKYPPAAHIEEIARWADSLDRI